MPPLIMEDLKKLNKIDNKEKEKEKRRQKRIEKINKEIEIEETVEYFKKLGAKEIKL